MTIPNVWTAIPPALITIAHAVLALVGTILLGLIVSPFLMRAPRRGPKTRGFGCFLYSAGLWTLIRGFIGGLGAIFGVAIYLAEKSKEINAVKEPLDKLQKDISVGWLLVFLCAIGLLEILGERLRKLSEKHHEIARWGFQKLFRSSVSPKFPEGLENPAQTVLAYRAVWTECFNVPGGKNLEGWKLSALRERVRLIYFTPPIMALQPTTASAGATVTVTGSGFDGARAVQFGYTPASAMNITSDAEVAATVPPGRGTVSVTVISRAGVESNPAASFSYTPPKGAPSTPLPTTPAAPPTVPSSTP